MMKDGMMMRDGMTIKTMTTNISNGLSGSYQVFTGGVL